VEPDRQPTYEELLRLLAERDATIARQTELLARQSGLIETLTGRVTELERRLGTDSANSSRPPSSDSPYTKSAPKRSSRGRSGRAAGKQPGDPGSTLRMVDDPDETVICDPAACEDCGTSLADAPVVGIRRHQVFDTPPPPPRPHVTEYQVVVRTCPCCGAPGVAGVAVPAAGRVQYGPGLAARAVWLTCAHHLPVRRAGQVLAALPGAAVSTGWVAGLQGRAARLLEMAFLPRVRQLITAAAVAHADETTARADGGLRYLHVACTDYLTVLHVGDRSAAAIDAGGVWPAFTGVLVRDGYAGYAHLTGAVHAWCGAHLLRDLRSVHDGDPAGQVWADAMAHTLLEARDAAHAARAAGQAALPDTVVVRIRRHYLGALARGDTDNHGTRSPLADDARTLIRRFRRYEDMILRFATDLTVPFTNNVAERDVRPVTVHQRTSGGCWRTLHGLADFAVVQSYLSTATKWGLDTLDVLIRLFTTGAWLPPAAQPA
jgi:transposase